MAYSLSETDRKQLQEKGIAEETVRAQIELFEKGPQYLDLKRPCTPGDGILALSEGEAKRYAARYGAEAEEVSILKFVPASGGATRMFRDLLAWQNRGSGPVDLDALADQGDSVADFVKTFFEDLSRFAFFPSLVKIAGDAEALSKKEELNRVLALVLEKEGLGYRDTPKGLVLFHRYGDECRTPYEEHLVEAADYARDTPSLCRLHFTVAGEHEKDFTALARVAGEHLGGRFSAIFDVSFSTQDPATDTLAVNPDKTPFRLDDGSLFFRPGGHGALLNNLNRVSADVIFINNIDNVVTDREKPERSLWKKALAGLLLEIREQVFGHLKVLDQGSPSEEELSKAAEFVEKTFHIPADGRTGDELKKFLFERLNRPLRVCGMVKNLGEPGGAPFWVREANGGPSLQIVESAQVNPHSGDQKKVFASSTHFNPVDVVASTRAFDGKKHDLGKFSDPDAVFISEKSKDGKDLLALELPGLWNGSMARWNSVFVDVPLSSFNPVKTVNDLLKPRHQGDIP